VIHDEFGSARGEQAGVAWSRLRGAEATGARDKAQSSGGCGTHRLAGAVGCKGLDSGLVCVQSSSWSAF